MSCFIALKSGAVVQQDLALMLQKMQAEPDDQPAQLCQRLELLGTESTDPGVACLTVA